MQLTKSNFKNIGIGLDTKKELKEEINSLDCISLSAYNPRLKTIPNLECNLIEFIKQESNKTPKRIFEELLEHEGDLSDLKNLFQSIHKYGFDSNNISDTILLVKKKQKIISS